MKIATWNLWFRNKDQKRAVDFLLTLGADIMCLQEIMPETLDYLKKLKGYYVQDSIDLYLNEEPIYKSTISKYALVASTVVPFTLQTKSCLAISSLPKIKIAKEAGDFFYSDCEVAHGKKVRVFNAHLASTTGPFHRLKQLDEVAVHFSSDHGNVICGDFNSFASLLLNAFVGPIYHYALAEYPINEWGLLQKFASEHHLKLPYRKMATHAFSRTHLDHIMVPSEWKIGNADVYKERHGSDHRLVMVEAQF